MLHLFPKRGQEVDSCGTSTDFKLSSAGDSELVDLLKQAMRHPEYRRSTVTYGLQSIIDFFELSGEFSIRQRDLVKAHLKQNDGLWV